MVHIYHTFQWYNKVHLKIICDFIFYQYEILNLILGYILSIFLKFRQSQPQCNCIVIISLTSGL